MHDPNQIPRSVSGDAVKLFGECTVYRDALRALQAQLIPIRAMPAVKRALRLIDDTLNPKDDLQ